MKITTTDIELFTAKTTKLVDDVLTARGLTKMYHSCNANEYNINWHSGTMFVKGVSFPDMMTVKDSVEKFTDMTFCRIGKSNEFAIDFK